MTEPAAAPPDHHPVLIVGAGPAGLAVAGSLRLLGRSSTVVDEAALPGSSWREHYERLHLHTVKSHSALPGLPFPDAAPRYVPRQGVVDYLEAYARHHGIEPLGGQTVVRITAGPTAEHVARWRVHTASGRVWTATHLVLATGANREPRTPVLPGQDAFTGRVLHSHAYRNAAPFKGQSVLVVGMGNTGAEIALDLVEQGVGVALSVRSPVNIVLRDVLGRPTQLSSIALARLPEPIGDACATLLRNLTVGDLSRWGLRTPAASPLHAHQARRDPGVPRHRHAHARRRALHRRARPGLRHHPARHRLPAPAAGPVPESPFAAGRTRPAHGAARRGAARRPAFRGLRHPPAGRAAAHDRDAGRARGRAPRGRGGAGLSEPPTPIGARGWRARRLPFRHILGLASRKKCAQDATHPIRTTPEERA
jgi:cation diffusion facilitator CzcD-associated flavoprotein CzcO